MSVRRDWVNWWACPWLTAHPDWWPDHLRGLSSAQCQCLSFGFHESLAAEFCITPKAVETPADALAALVLANDDSLQLMARLCSACCYPRSESGLDQHHEQWCTRLAKGVRPGQWLAEEGHSLRLLKAWMNDAQWQRFRLRLSHAEVRAIEETSLSKMPLEKQLTTLWAAIVWQATK